MFKYVSLILATVLLIGGYFVYTGSYKGQLIEDTPSESLEESQLSFIPESISTSSTSFVASSTQEPSASVAVTQSANTPKPKPVMTPQPTAVTPATPEPTPTTMTEPTAPITTTQASGITVAELATHNSKQDCWIVYKGGVYDVTSYLPMHPGGSNRISQFCGVSDTSFAQAFERQHRTKYVSQLKSQAGTYEGDMQ